LFAVILVIYLNIKREQFTAIFKDAVPDEY